MLRITTFAALLAFTTPAFAEEEIYQDVVVIQTETTTVATTDQGFDTIEPAAGPSTLKTNNTATPQQQREYELHRYDDTNYKG